MRRHCLTVSVQAVPDTFTTVINQIKMKELTVIHPNLHEIAERKEKARTDHIPLYMCL